MKKLTWKSALAFGALFCLALIIAPKTGSANVGDWFAALLQQDDRPPDVVGTDFKTAVRSFLNYFLGFLGLVAVIFVIYAGVLMVTAGGDDDQVGKGKKILLWAAVGIVLVLLSYAIVSWVVGAGTAGTV